MPPQKLIIRRAQARHASIVANLFIEAAQRPALRRAQQWQYNGAQWVKYRQGIDRDIRNGHVWLLDDGRNPAAATLTLNDYADPEFWSEDDNPSAALYVHRMIVTDTARGQEYGSAMLD